MERSLPCITAGTLSFSYAESQNPCDPARCEQFLAQLRPETAAKIRNLHIFLGPCIDESFVEALVPSIARFPHLGVAIAPFGALPVTLVQEMRVSIEQAVRLIAEARSGAVTVWDAEGDVGSLEMLDSLLPAGYQRKT